MLQAKTVNCSYTYGATHYGFTDLELTVNERNQGLFFVNLAVSVRYVIFQAFIVFIVGAINKLIFDLNIFEAKWKHLRVHKEILTMIELALLALTINQLVIVDRVAEPLRLYLKHGCGVVNERSLPFQAPFVSLYVSCIVVLFMHAVTFIIYISNAKSAKLHHKDEIPLE